MKYLIPIILMILFITGCGGPTMKLTNYEKVNLIPSDNVKIAGNYVEQDNEKGVLLIHMNKGRKEDWNSLIHELNGYNVLAIDLRGHGESDLNYNSLNEDFSSMKNDVEAGIIFLKNKGVKRIGVIGASIGANLAINSDGNVVIALSPGLEYKNIKTEFNNKNPVLIIVSDDDSYSLESSNEIEKSLENAKLIELMNRGHGTRMLDSEVNKMIVGFLDENL